jgi:hypothetical protein
MYCTSLAEQQLKTLESILGYRTTLEGRLLGWGVDYELIIMTTESYPLCCLLRRPNYRPICILSSWSTNGQHFRTLPDNTARDVRITALNKNKLL